MRIVLKNSTIVIATLLMATMASLLAISLGILRMGRQLTDTLQFFEILLALTTALIALQITFLLPSRTLYIKGVLVGDKLKFLSRMALQSTVEQPIKFDTLVLELLSNRLELRFRRKGTRILVFSIDRETGVFSLRIRGPSRHQNEIWATLILSIAYKIVKKEKMLIELFSVPAELRGKLRFHVKRKLGESNASSLD